MTLKTLDWKKEILFGYEESSHLLLVEALRLGIRSNDDIKPFDVFQISENEYILSYNLFSKNNGGHHRAIAYYQELKNPSVNIVEPFNQNVLNVVKSSMIPIESVKLFDYRTIPIKELREYYEKQFWARAKNYPRLKEILSQNQ